MTCRDNAVFSPVPSSLITPDRKGDPRMGSWISHKEPAGSPFHLIIGCPDDTGIKLNFGRPGAALAPQEIRRAFYRMAVPAFLSESPYSIFDGGDIKVESEIKKTHSNVTSALKKLANRAFSVVVLGGGHDFAAPAFKGFAQSHSEIEPSASFGLINVDPHLDVRELESGNPHSGSAFRQLLESSILAGTNLIQFGCRENRNAHSHFEFCRKQGVELCSFQEIKKSKSPVSEVFNLKLSQLSSRVSHLGITLDMDSCSEILGTSAAPAIGFSVEELCEMAEMAGMYNSVRYFEIAEVSPPLDPSGKTALAAAEILMSFYRGKFKTEKT